MTISSDTPRQEAFSSTGPFEERFRRFESQQVTLLAQIAASRQLRLSLRTQRESLAQEREILEQELLGRWEDLQARWQHRVGCERQLGHLRQRMQMRQQFASEVLYERQRFSLRAQSFQERMAALHERHALLRALSDRSQQQESYRELKAGYRELQQELRDWRAFLQEQRALYSQVRLDLASDAHHLDAQQSVLWRRKQR